MNEYMKQYDAAKVAKLRESINEAERFIAAAKTAIADIEPERNYSSGYFITFATAKRASMDLTRSLARLRRTEQP